MRSEKAPAFYALPAGSAWKDYVNLLHLPYTLWHLSYVVLGAAIAPSIHLDRLLVTLLAFFLAVGIGAHALDELNGRPLGTRIPRPVLVGLGFAPLAGAVILGAAGAVVGTMWVLPFVAFGGFIVIAYNLGLWNDRFHSDFWFAFAWGAFPALTSYWINSSHLSLLAVLLAFGCFTLSLAQRTLSTQVRTIRRKTLSVEGSMEMADGSRVMLDSRGMLSAPERALSLLSLTIVVFAGSLLAFRL
ncbi:MAG: hypothetical protein AAB528_00895 [Chloroflexota bacterium]